MVAQGRRLRRKTDESTMREELKQFQPLRANTKKIRRRVSPRTAAKRAFHGTSIRVGIGYKIIFRKRRKGSKNMPSVDKS